MQFLLIVIYVLLAGTVTVHVLLTKSDVRAALGWIAVAWLSPVFGALLYFVFGINRVTRRALHFAKLEHERGCATGPDAWPPVPPNIAALSAIAQRVTGSPLIAGTPFRSCGAAMKHIRRCWPPSAMPATASHSVLIFSAMTRSGAPSSLH